MQPCIIEIYDILFQVSRVSNLVAALEPVTHCLVNMVGFVKKNTKVLLVTVPNRLTRYGNVGCGVSNTGIQNQENNNKT